MTWSLALALLWIGLVVPVGHVLGRALRRIDDRDASPAPVETAAAPAALPALLGPPSGPLPERSAGGPDALSRHA